MKRKGIYLARQLVLGLIALQILNLSVGNSFNTDDGYDYSYSYNKNYDPTESAVEWIVELNYGQQQAFSYDVHQEDAGKTPVKAFHWKTDVQHYLPLPAIFLGIMTPRVEIPSGSLLSPAYDQVSPPPEISVA